MQPAEPALPALRLMLTFRAEETLRLPPFRGAMWRGVLGRALKRIAEADPLDETAWPATIRPVATGPFPRAEIYRALFAPEHAVAAIRRPPPPFVIDAPGDDARAVPAGGTELIGMTLIGEAAAATLPAVLAAFAAAARDGLGKGRGRAALTEAAIGWRAEGGYQPVMSADGLVSTPAALVPEAPAMPRAVEVVLAAPLRLVSAGRVIDPEDFSPGLLLEQIVRRVSLLQRLYGPGPVPADFSALFARARQARMRAPDLWWAEQERWSASREEEIPMDGIVGGFTLPLDGLEPLWPWLWTAQWFHVGKGAVMGLGAVRLRTV